MAAIHDVRERLPGAGLASHVACVWVQEVASESAAFTHRAAPHGSVELVCAPGSLPRIVGPQTGALAIELAPGDVLVGVRLRPEAAAAVLGFPASELVDVSLELEDEALAERIAEAASPAEAATWLERAVPVGAPVDPVVAAATARLIASPRVEIGALAASVTLSERQLRRRFETATGLGPKTLQRILRFQRFLALVWASEPPVDVARLAVEAGYVDQSHLSREAARLEGRTPRRFLAESGERCGCAHDHLASYGPFLRARSTNGPSEVAKTLFM